jgi:hypothetical protein
MSQNLREEGTANWLTAEQIYKEWQEDNSLIQLPAPSSFGSNVLWVYGRL